MIRNKYRLNNHALYYLLLQSRGSRTHQFEAMISARDAHIIWKARLHTNNKHTFGSEA